MRRKVYDGFLFFDELDLLELRLREMAPVVDRFILVESVETFQGAPKPLVFQQNKARFARWAHQIEHVVLPARPAPEPGKYGVAWAREFFQRDQIGRGLSGARPHDLVVVSDVDEILSAPVLAREAAAYRPGRPVVYGVGMYRFRLNLRAPEAVWPGPRMIEARLFPGAQKLRRLKAHSSKAWRRVGLAGLGVRWRNLARSGLFLAPRRVDDAGWHFSSIGGLDSYRRKVDAYSHVEYKQTPEYLSAAAFDAWVEAHRIVSNERLPASVAAGLFPHLLADARRPTPLDASAMPSLIEPAALPV